MNMTKAECSQAINNLDQRITDAHADVDELQVEIRRMSAQRSNLIGMEFPGETE